MIEYIQSICCHSPSLTFTKTLSSSNRKHSCLPFPLIASNTLLTSAYYLTNPTHTHSVITHIIALCFPFPSQHLFSFPSFNLPYVNEETERFPTNQVQQIRPARLQGNNSTTLTGLRRKLFDKSNNASSMVIFPRKFRLTGKYRRQNKKFSLIYQAKEEDESPFATTVHDKNTSTFIFLHANSRLPSKKSTKISMIWPRP